MKTSDLAARLARSRHISKPEAADRVDRLVHQILHNLRHGRPASLPGVGILRPGKQIRFRSEPAPSRPAKSAPRGKRK